MTPTVTPAEYRRRVGLLNRRGLHEDLVLDIWVSGDADLLCSVERMSDDEIAALNAAHERGLVERVIDPRRGR